MHEKKKKHCCCFVIHRDLSFPYAWARSVFCLSETSKQTLALDLSLSGLKGCIIYIVHDMIHFHGKFRSKLKKKKTLSQAKDNQSFTSGKVFPAPLINLQPPDSSILIWSSLMTKIIFAHSVGLYTLLPRINLDNRAACSKIP